jgi:hypothetical protein
MRGGGAKLGGRQALRTPIENLTTETRSARRKKQIDALRAKTNSVNSVPPW